MKLFRLALAFSGACGAPAASPAAAPAPAPSASAPPPSAHATLAPADITIAPTSIRRFGVTIPVDTPARGAPASAKKDGDVKSFFLVPLVVVEVVRGVAGDRFPDVSVGITR